MIYKTRQLSFNNKKNRRGVISKANNKNSNFSSDFFKLPKNYGRLYQRLIIKIDIFIQRIFFMLPITEYEPRIGYINL